MNLDVKSITQVFFVDVAQYVQSSNMFNKNRKWEILKHATLD